MDEWEIHNGYFRKRIHTEDDDFMFEEACNSLIINSSDPVAMINLADHYYKEQNYELALKYFEMADACGEPFAAEHIGDIWYNGYTGRTDYEKAFHCYSKMAEHYTPSTFKLADMYRYGQYVEQDYEKYCSMIEDMYAYFQNVGNPNCEADVCLRMAEILLDRGQEDEADDLLQSAKFELSLRMSGMPSVEDLRLMKRIIDLMYSIMPIKEAELDLFDLYYLLKEPATVEFYGLSDEKYIIRSTEYEEGISIQFKDQWYRSVEDFFRRAKVGEMYLIQLRDVFNSFKVVEIGTDQIL